MKKKILFVIILIVTIFFIEPQMINSVNAKNILEHEKTQEKNFAPYNIQTKITEEVPIEKIVFNVPNKTLLKGVPL